MTKSSTFAKGCVAATVGLMALGAAAAASAQPAPTYNNYDPCQRDANGRGVAGALIGGAGGAVIGSQLAAGGHRTDGSLLGGAIGAIAGAVVGHKTAACTDAPPPPQGYGPGPSADAGPPPPPQGYEQRYQPGPPPPPPAYGAGYAPPPPPPGYYAPREAVFVYGRHGVRYRVVDERIGPDGCTIAESPIYFPDGRVDRRIVHVCPDYRGRYRVVD
jgi:Glycine zipper 2TM domain